MTTTHDPLKHLQANHDLAAFDHPVRSGSVVPVTQTVPPPPDAQPASPLAGRQKMGIGAHGAEFDPATGRWYLELDDYQRDNLLWLFNVMGFSDRASDTLVEPFQFANTGDWLGEIAAMLAKPGPDGRMSLTARRPGSRPNSDPDVLRANVALWLKHKLPSLLPHASFAARYQTALEEIAALHWAAGSWEEMRAKLLAIVNTALAGGTEGG